MNNYLYTLILLLGTSSLVHAAQTQTKTLAKQEYITPSDEQCDNIRDRIKNIAISLAKTIEKFSQEQEFHKELCELLEQEFGKEFAQFDPKCDSMNKARYTTLTDIIEILGK